jgi:hypothetical protein
MIDSKNLLENYTIQHRIESILYSMEMIWFNCYFLFRIKIKDIFDVLFTNISIPFSSMSSHEWWFERKKNIIIRCC